MLNSKNYDRQAGTAVFMALLVVTIVSSLAIVWHMQSRLSIRRTQQMIISDQIYSLAQVGRDWAITLLKTTPSESKFFLDNSWPKIFPTTKLSGLNARISARLDDYQARLNINDLTEANVSKAFVKLLMSIAEISENEALELKTAALAWITPSKIATPAMINLNSQYAEYSTPYRPANRSLLSITELCMVNGFTPKIMSSLEPYISALPKHTDINLSHAAPAVLRAFNLEKPAASSIISEYFMLTTNVQFGKQQLVLYTLLVRNTKEGKITVNIIWHSLGSL